MEKNLINLMEKLQKNNAIIGRILNKNIIKVLFLKRKEP